MIDIPFKAEVDIGDGAKSLKALKQEFKDAQKELDGLNVGTKEYINTLQKLGGIKDKIGDLNQEINAFHPEGKIQSVTTVVGGLASGFQAATGAAALFGGESEDLQKALLKVQAVMAFTEGLKGLTSLGDAFTVLGNVIKANPIGAFITAVAALGAGLVALYYSLDKTSESTKELNKQAEKQKEIVTQLTGIIERELELLTAQGASEEVLIETKKKLINAKILEAEISIQLHRSKIEDIKANETLTESYYKLMEAIARKTGQEQLAEVYMLAIVQNKKERAQEDIDAIKKSEEDLRNFKNSLLVIDAEFHKTNAVEKKKQDDEDWKAAEVEAERRSKIDIDRQKRDTDLKIKLAERHRDAEIKSAQEAKDEAGKMYDEDVENKKKANEAKEKLNKQYFENSVAQEQATMQLIQTVTDIYFQYKFARTRKDSAEELELKKKQFKINKAYQLAQTAIDGARAVINASGQSPYFYVGLSASIAASIATTAAIAKIAATKFDGGGGGSSGGGGGFAITGSPNTSPPPQINPPTSGNTQLNPDGTIKSLPQQPQQVVKAIVVETDVTDTQKRVSMIETNAKL